MPRLTGSYRRQLRRGLRGDRGAAATLVGILLAGGVLLGMTAMVVDVGQLYAEREELMSGADAAATAVALDCAMDRPACDTDPVTGEGPARDTAISYAGQNARDGSTGAIVCGNHPGLRSCDDPAFDPIGNLTDCLGERPTDGTRYVEVRTTTRLPDGSTLLPPSFAQTFVSGYEGTTVGACARVAWGAPGHGLAVTLSRCELDNATSEGTDFADPPPPDPDPSYERVIVLHTQDPECDAAIPGSDGPGGFGWLDGDNCEVEIVQREDGYWYGTNTGNDVPPDCRSLLPELRESKTVVAVPIFDDVQGTGNNLEYHLSAIAGFVVTGYNNPGLRAPSNLPGSTIGECRGEVFCIYGYFTEVVAADEIGPLPSLGAVAVSTIG